jgi:hypothetical protein
MHLSHFARSVRAPLLALAALPLFAAAAAAQEPTGVEAGPGGGPYAAFVLEGVVEYGGDNLGTILYEDGSEQKMLSGQGATLAVGGQVRPSFDSPLALRATVGFKYQTTAATNANITFTRVPIEVVASYDLTDDVWAGAGYVRHTAVKFRGDDIAPDEDFEDGNGATVELGWRWVALTYTAMKYTSEAGGEYNAGTFGLSFMWVHRP